MSSTPTSTVPPWLSLQPDDPFLISPTKARQAATTAKLWYYVDSRLRALYAPSKVPLFERNDDTLQALLSLVRANEAADAERMILHRARLEELEAYEASHDEILASRQNENYALSAPGLMHDIESSLSGQESQRLHDMAAAAVHTGTVDLSTTGIAERIVDRTRSDLRAQAHLQRLRALQQSLETRIAELQHLLESHQTQREIDAQHADKLQQERSVWDHEVKQLKFKLTEYRERIAGLERHTETITCPKVEDIVAQEKMTLETENRVEKMVNRVRGFAGLPPDVEAAEGEIGQAKGELVELIRQREGMFTQSGS